MKDNLLKALCREGVLISVSIRFWRARKQLNASDLGIDPDKVDKRLISLGHKRLLPKECMAELSLIESRAHALVEANTFPFLNGVARYLPNAKLEEVMAKLNELRDEFTQKQNEFFAHYSDLRMSALDEWHQQADDLAADPERFLSVIRAAFPDMLDLPRYFSFSVKSFALTIPNVPQAELLRQGEQEEIIRARRKAAREAKREIERSCEEFIAESVLTLREQTAKLCTDMLSTIQGTGSVHQKTLNRLVKFIDHFKSLNFVGDDKMEQWLDDAKTQFLNLPAAEYRENSRSKNNLMSGLSTLRDHAHDLAQEDASHLVENFGRIGKRKLDLA